jgi:putative lipoprotein
MASDDPAVVDGPAVTGAVVLPDAAELPEDAVWSVELQDASKQDVAAEVISLDEGDASDLVEGMIAFEITYDEELIDERLTYSLSARVIDADETLLYINDTFTPGVVDGEPLVDVQIEVIDVQAQAAEAEVMPAEAEASPEA